MIYNFEFTLKDGKPMDVTDICMNGRVVYFPERNSVIFVKSKMSAEKYAEKYDGEVMTRRAAAGRYPDKFFDSRVKLKDKMYMTLLVPAEMYAFCRRKGIIGDYIRGLIQREMDREHFNP